MALSSTRCGSVDNCSMRDARTRWSDENQRKLGVFAGFRAQLQPMEIVEVPVGFGHGPLVTCPHGGMRDGHGSKT